MTVVDDDALVKSYRSSGILFVTAWLHDDLVLARVTHMSDDPGAPVTVVVVGRNALHEEIDRWVNSLVEERPESKTN